MQTTIAMLMFIVSLALALPQAVAQAAGLPLAGQGARKAIDFDAQRLPIALVGVNWRFHPGDDMRWAQPEFDDSGWKLLQPGREWGAQGYTEEHDMAWLRFKVRVPAELTSAVLELPAMPKNYQVFADGRMIGHVGTLPPEDARQVVATAQVFTVPVPAGSAGQAREITIALRLWQAASLTGLRTNIVRRAVYVGDGATVLRQFALIKSASLLSQGSSYTHIVIVTIVAAAALLLFWLTRQDFYLWFAASLFFSSTTLPIQLASQHFGWEHLPTLRLYTLADFLTQVTFAMFVLGMLGVRTWKKALLAALLALGAEMGPLLLLFAELPLVWANGIYFFFAAALQGTLIFYLVKGWRACKLDAKLLLIPYAIDVLFSTSGNLAHWLVSLNVPRAGQLVPGDIQLLREPFVVDLAEVGGVVSLLGMLAVLVYRFARTSYEQQRLASALQAAHDVQHRLVPENLPSIGGLQTDVVYLAAEEVGGDFCQVLQCADGSILVAIGDVSGKGLEAAMLGTLTVGALRSIADESLEPAAVLERLNQVLLRTENARFVTCLCLTLKPTGEMRVANAGHLSPYLNGVELELDAGLPLGIIAEPGYTQRGLMLPAAARLTLLSDGVVEARSKDGQLFGFDRTCAVSQLSAAQIAEAAHQHGQEDDITIVTLDWRAPVPDAAAA